MTAWLFRSRRTKQSNYSSKSMYFEKSGEFRHRKGVCGSSWSGYFSSFCFITNFPSYFDLPSGNHS